MILLITETPHNAPPLLPPLTFNGDQGRTSGYGRAVKDASITPIVEDNRIKYAVVVLVWNPHSSSMGVPIPHKP
jgi:hypothetical protein